MEHHKLRRLRDLMQSIAQYFKENHPKNFLLLANLPKISCEPFPFLQKTPSSQPTLKSNNKKIISQKSNQTNPYHKKNKPSQTLEQCHTSMPQSTQQKVNQIEKLKKVNTESEETIKKIIANQKNFIQKRSEIILPLFHEIYHFYKKYASHTISHDTQTIVDSPAMIEQQISPPLHDQFPQVPILFHPSLESQKSILTQLAAAIQKFFAVSSHLFPVETCEKWNFWKPILLQSHIQLLIAPEKIFNVTPNLMELLQKPLKTRTIIEINNKPLFILPEDIHLSSQKSFVWKIITKFFFLSSKGG